MFKLFAYSLKSHTFGIIAEYPCLILAKDAYKAFYKKHWSKGGPGYLQPGIYSEGVIIHPKPHGGAEPAQIQL